MRNLRWTPLTAGIVIGFCILLSYYFYDGMGMCVGCFVGHTWSWLEHKLTGHPILTPGIPYVFRTPMIGFFIGAFLASLLAKEFWRRGVKPKTLIVSFLAGCLISFGNFLGGGCPIRHGIVGSVGLTLEGLAGFTSMIIGIWSGTLLIKKLTK